MKNKTIDYGQLERMTAMNVSMASICRVLEISPQTYYNRRANDPEFAAAIRRGLEQKQNGPPVENDADPLGDGGGLERVLGNIHTPTRRPRTPKESTPAAIVAKADDPAVIGKLTVNFYADGSIMTQMRGDIAREALRAVFA